jgi:ACR3 family arsenite efflux pump ArsB
MKRSLQVLALFSARALLSLLILLFVYVGLGIASVPTFVGTTTISLFLWMSLMLSIVFLWVLISYGDESKWAPRWLSKVKARHFHLTLMLAVALEITSLAAGDYKVSSILPSGDPLRGTHYLEIATAIWFYVKSSQGKTKPVSK